MKSEVAGREERSKEVVEICRFESQLEIWRSHHVTLLSPTAPAGCRASTGGIRACYEVMRCVWFHCLRWYCSLGFIFIFIS